MSEAKLYFLYKDTSVTIRLNELATRHEAFSNANCTRHFQMPIVPFRRNVTDEKTTFYTQLKVTMYETSEVAQGEK